MGYFNIDFFELSFLAEACIPPTPIARAHFWQQLTNVYWEQMTNNERARLFEWLNRNDRYLKSLKDNEDTQIFHARFDPENQYYVYVTFKKKDSVISAFKFKDKYYTDARKHIDDSYITKVEKINNLNN